MTASSNAQPVSRDVGGGAPVFSSILCGVNGSRPGFEAARQAARLAGDGAALTYLAVAWEAGFGPVATAQINRRHAGGALVRAREEAAKLGLAPAITVSAAENAAQRLMDVARRHDLLVIGIHSRTRAGGIFVGTTATTILHRAPVPVLIARHPPGPYDFPDRILLAIDARAPSVAATRITARLAARHGSEVLIIASRRDAALAEQAATITDHTGREPLILDEHGTAHKAIAHAAAEVEASLVVTGSRGLAGVRAIRSVSERVAHAAPCSVLVVRATTAR